MLFDFLLSMEAKRKKLAQKAPDGALKQFLQAPLPPPSTPISQTPMLALDFETTGLDANQDKLLSLGYVDIIDNRIKLSTAHHQIIQCKQQLTSSNVAIHQITHQEAIDGIALEAAVEQLLNALAGKVMLVHYAKVEQTFLAKACYNLYGMAPIYPIIDSLVVAKRRLDQRQAAYDPSQLRLTQLRERFNLPAHFAHNALNDAIATGELLFAELAHHHNANKPLKHFLR